MPYEHILTLIDEYLERLQAVRTLLALTEIPPAKSRQKRVLPPQKLVHPISIRMTLAEANVEKDIPIPQETPNVGLDPLPPEYKKESAERPGTEDAVSPLEPSSTGDSVRKVQSLETPDPARFGRVSRSAGTLGLKALEMPRSRVTVKKILASPGTALGGLVPAKPVFIPIERLKLDQVLRDGAAKRASSTRVSEEELLTAEMLTQRWSSVTKLR